MATATSVAALVPGDHACLTFSDPDERLDIVATFVRDGLRSAAKVLCLTGAIPPAELAQELRERGVPVAEALPSSQLTIFGGDESWLAGGEVTAALMIERIGRHLADAEAQGFAGTFDAVTLAFATATHPRLVAAAVYYEDAVLRICRQHLPPGIRLAGELDYHRLDELTLALDEALRLDHDPQVNLSRLRFVDATAASTICNAALSLPAGRVMSILCNGAVLRMLRFVGAAEIPAVRLVSARGER